MSPPHAHQPSLTEQSKNRLFLHLTRVMSPLLTELLNRTFFLPSRSPARHRPPHLQAADCSYFVCAVEYAIVSLWAHGKRFCPLLHVCTSLSKLKTSRLKKRFPLGERLFRRSQGITFFPPASEPTHTLAADKYRHMYAI